ncbi:MAG: thiopeptide-type bacteriocin biosynthesis protein, partial [Muribaculaceae bacterium]|nr:thiopeptide-type bacteriocin biosynthesis protein [Muribaculaceae bacterium]
IYLKIYINPIISNFVLINYIRPIVDDIYPSIADKWFFLRYNDPDYHIRLRFHFSNKRKLIMGLNHIQSHLKNAVLDGYVHSWTINGYNRELERYGKENINKTEEIFCINSELVTKSLKYLSESSFSTNCLALWTIDNILVRFIEDHVARADYCQKIMHSYMLEMNISEDSKISMNTLYRRYKNILNSFSPFGKNASCFTEKISSFLKEHNEALNIIMGTMNDKQLKTLNFGSIIHMNINRLYQIDARKVEMVLYYLLYKKYVSDSFKRDK